MAVRIYTDASSNLYPSILKKKDADIVVLPMTLRIEGKEYHCYSDNIDVEKMSQDFYEEMKNGAKPQTALVSPGFFLSKCEEDIARGNEVIYITLSSGISGTYQSALLMAKEANEKAGKEAVKVLDSKTAGLGEGRIALKAYEYAREGLSFTEVISKIEKYIEIVRSEFTVDSIKYLANTGRVSNFKALIAGVLSIKPLLYGSKEGKIEVTSKAHGRKNAIKKLAEQVNENIVNKDQTVYIAHCNSLLDAQYLEHALHEFGIDHTEIYFYDLVTGAHVGPGTIAVFYEGKNRDIPRKSVISSLFGK